MGILYRLILRTGHDWHEITLRYIYVRTWATRDSVIFLYYLKHVLVTLVIDTVLNRLNLSWSLMLVIAVQASVILGRVVFVVCRVCHDSTWATALRTSFEWFVLGTSDGSTIAEPIYVRKNLSNRRTVFHISCPFFSWLVIWIERPVVNARQLVMIRWILFVRGISTRAGNPHVLPCLLVSLVVRVLAFGFDAYLFESLSPGVSIDGIFFATIFTVLFFVPIVVSTALVLCVKISILLKARFALRFAGLSPLGVHSSWWYGLQCALWFWPNSIGQKHYSRHFRAGFGWSVFGFGESFSQRKDILAQSDRLQ